MVTASHNPPEYNGYKVYWGNGAQIIPPHDVGIAAAIARVGPARDIPLRRPRRRAARAGWSRDVGPELERAYLDGVARAPARTRARARTSAIVYTPMHGVGGALALEALRRAGFARVHPVAEQHEPDAAFPTVRFPNPEEKGAMDLSRAARRARPGADLVLANDPDADRLAVLPARRRASCGRSPANEVGVLLGHYLLTQGPRRERPLVVTTIVSSSQLGAIARAAGRALRRDAHRLQVDRQPRDGARGQGRRASFVFGYEEALGYTVGDARPRQGRHRRRRWCSPTWPAGAGRAGPTVLGYLEEIQREFGLFVSRAAQLHPPGRDRGRDHRPGDGRLPARPAGAGGRAHGGDGARTTRPGRAPPTDAPSRSTLPPSNVLAYGLEGGGAVTLRPSGTEPKIKYYFELPERLSPGEEVETARRRGEQRLEELERDFLELATARGQPRV